MDNSSDVFQDVSLENMKEYKIKLMRNYPLAMPTLRFIETIQYWKRVNPDLNMSIIGPNGNPNLGIIIQFQTDKMLYCGVYADDKNSAEELRRAFTVSQCKPFLSVDMALFICMTELSLGVFKDVVGPHLNVTKLTKNTVFWLPWYIARDTKVHIPEGVEIRKLTKDHAKLINSLWPHRYPGSEDFIAQMIEVFFGFGVFRGDSLLSWALLWYYGAIGSVQTLETEKRKGYARAVVETITKKMGDMQMDVHLNIVDGNTGSEAFFKALGFRYAFNSTWATVGCME